MRFKSMVLVLTPCCLIGNISNVSNKSAPSLFKVEAGQVCKSRGLICNSCSQLYGGPFNVPEELQKTKKFSIHNDWGPSR